MLWPFNTNSLLLLWLQDWQFSLLSFRGEGIIVPLLPHIDKLNFTYLGKLRLPDYIVYSGAVVDKGARVDEQK